MTRISIEGLRLKAEIAALEERITAQEKEIAALEKGTAALEAWRAQWEEKQKKEAAAGAQPLIRRPRSDSDEAVEVLGRKIGRAKAIVAKKH